MIRLLKLAAVLSAVFSLNAANAAFPDDLEGVVFIEGPSMERIRSYPETSNLEVTVTAEPQNRFGRVIFLDYEKRFEWAADNNNVNGNVWGFVKIDDVWYAGTWEYMGFGRIDRSEASFVGPKHLRFPPLSNFRPVDGEVYGFMVTPVVRNGTRPSVEERTKVDFFRWGVGPVEREEIFGSAGATSIAPAVDLLLSE